MEPSSAALSLTLQHAVTGKNLVTWDDLEEVRDQMLLSVPLPDTSGACLCCNCIRLHFQRAFHPSICTVVTMVKRARHSQNLKSQQGFTQVKAHALEQESTTALQLRQRAASALGLRDVTVLRLLAAFSAKRGAVPACSCRCGCPRRGPGCGCCGRDCLCVCVCVVVVVVVVFVVVVGVVVVVFVLVVALGCGCSSFRFGH